jgi:hypothetical protein
MASLLSEVPRAFGDRGKRTSAEDNHLSAMVPSPAVQQVSIVDFSDGRYWPTSELTHSGGPLLFMQGTPDIGGGEARSRGLSAARSGCHA